MNQFVIGFAMTFVLDFCRYQSSCDVSIVSLCFQALEPDKDIFVSEKQIPSSQTVKIVEKFFRPGTWAKLEPLDTRTSSFSEACFVLLCFHERLPLAPVVTNGKKSEEEFRLYKKKARST